MYSVNRTGNAKVDANLDLIAEELTRLAKNLIPFDKAVRVSLSAADTRVAHGLTGPPRFVLVLRKNAGETVFDGDNTPAANPDIRRYINLRATGNVTATLVFL